MIISTPCASNCTLPRRHLDDCRDTAACRGCLPARAADGSRVCPGCERRVRESLRILADVYADLADTRRGAGPGRMGSSGPLQPEACPRCDRGEPCDVRHREAAPPLSEARLRARSGMRVDLVAWCTLLEEDFGLTLPTGEVSAMAHHVSVQAGRLLASEFAARLVTDARRWWDAQRVAYPSRPDPTILCQCGGRVRVDMEELMTCRTCGAWGAWDWWRGVLVEPPAEMTAQDLMDWLLTEHQLAVNYATLRSWRIRHAGVAAGRTAGARALYHRDAVLALARRVRHAPASPLVATSQAHG